MNKLTDMHLDFDDDLFLFKNFENLVKIWEFYEIHSTIPRKLLSYGHWNNGGGLVIPKPLKWERRGNLEVVLFYIFVRLNDKVLCWEFFRVLGKRGICIKPKYLPYNV